MVLGLGSGVKEKVGGIGFYNLCKLITSLTQRTQYLLKYFLPSILFLYHILNSFVFLLHQFLSFISSFQLHSSSPAFLLLSFPTFSFSLPYIFFPAYLHGLSSFLYLYINLVCLSVCLFGCLFVCIQSTSKRLDRSGPIFLWDLA